MPKRNDWIVDGRVNISVIARGADWRVELMQAKMRAVLPAGDAEAYASFLIFDRAFDDRPERFLVGRQWDRLSLLERSSG